MAEEDLQYKSVFANRPQTSDGTCGHPKKGGWTCSLQLWRQHWFLLLIFHFWTRAGDCCKSCLGPPKLQISTETTTLRNATRANWTLHSQLSRQRKIRLSRWYVGKVSTWIHCLLNNSSAREASQFRSMRQLYVTCTLKSCSSAVLCGITELKSFPPVTCAWRNQTLNTSTLWTLALGWIAGCGTWEPPESVGVLVALAADRGVTRNQLGFSLVTQLSSTVARRQPPSPPTLPRWGGTTSWTQPAAGWQQQELSDCNSRHSNPQESPLTMAAVLFIMAYRVSPTCHCVSKGLHLPDWRIASMWQMGWGARKLINTSDTTLKIVMGYLYPSDTFSAVDGYAWAKF